MAVPVEPMVEVPLNSDDARHRSQGRSIGTIARDPVAFTKPPITLSAVPPWHAASREGRKPFPTGATANPTLTIAALSLRAAERVKAALTE